ncbi:MAG TPA: S8 family serine peptidase, partial [Acidimicrobiales bacterium]
GCANTPDNVVDIDPGAGTAFDVTIAATNPPAANNTITATLQWSEPRAIFPTVGQGGFTDLNLYVMNAGLTQCLAQSTTVQASGQGDTIEQVSFTTAVGTNLKLVVDVQGTSSAVAAPTLDLRWRGANAVDTTTRAGSLNPDSNYTGAATSSAAIDAVGGGIEGFSAGGPVQLGSTTVCTLGDAPPCVGAAGGGIVSTPGPTWGAADNVQVTGVGGFGSPFGGTSAAAPHAAACDALVRDARPATNTVALVTARLKATATDLAPAGSDNITGAGQLVCFRADPTITTTATSSVFSAANGPSISDTAVLANGFNPTGTITFQAFGPNNASCTGGAAFTSAPTVTGNGNYSSGPFSPAAEGAYRWVVTYGGDQNNSTATSPCNAANETSTVVSVCATPPQFGTLPGNNIVVSAPGLITVGTSGNDVIYGTAGIDRIFGAGGDDIVFALGGDDQVTGGDGRDSLCGGDGNDRLTGDAGNDLLVGGNNNDDLAGLAGDDRLIGGTGVDRLTGGVDIDTCTPGTGVGSQTVLCEVIV